jgi:hypothetical protein
MASLLNTFPRLPCRPCAPQRHYKGMLGLHVCSCLWPIRLLARTGSRSMSLVHFCLHTECHYHPKELCHDAGAALFFPCFKGIAQRPGTIYWWQNWLLPSGLAGIPASRDLQGTTAYSPSSNPILRPAGLDGCTMRIDRGL